MFGIKKYFGRRSNNEISPDIDIDGDVEITREVPLELRPGNPITTSFNRKLVIGLVGFFAFVFLFSMFYGMTKSGPDIKSQEETVKDKKVVSVAQNNNQLDKLPSSYGGKLQNAGTSNGEQGLSQPPIQDLSTFPRQSPQSVNYTPPRSSYQAVDYNSPPPIPGRPQAIPQQKYDSSEPVVSTVNSTVNSIANKEEQELAEARKSPIRFNLK